MRPLPVTKRKDVEEGDFEIEMAFIQDILLITFKSSFGVCRRPREDGV